jgi:hypothetical protein
MRWTGHGGDDKRLKIFSGRPINRWKDTRNLYLREMYIVFR